MVQERKILLRGMLEEQQEHSCQRLDTYTNNVEDVDEGSGHLGR